MTWPTTRPPAPEIPHFGNEMETLNGFLDFYRAALIDRAWGLTDDQLQIALPPSPLTLSRLIGHMAAVEETWFRYRFAGEEMSPVVQTFDWEADEDAEMTHAQSLNGDELLALFNNAVEDSKARVAAASSLDQSTERAHPVRDERWSLRWILVHMIEEYARHCGHADLIREHIDGDTAG